jgi:hypothetical protein
MLLQATSSSLPVARHPTTVLTERDALTLASLPLPRQRFKYSGTYPSAQFPKMGDVFDVLPKSRVGPRRIFRRSSVPIKNSINDADHVPKVFCLALDTEATMSGRRKGELVLSESEREYRRALPGPAP